MRARGLFQPRFYCYCSRSPIFGVRKVQNISVGCSSDAHDLPELRFERRDAISIVRNRTRYIGKRNLDFRLRWLRVVDDIECLVPELMPLVVSSEN